MLALLAIGSGARVHAQQPATSTAAAVTPAATAAAPGAPASPGASPVASTAGEVRTLRAERVKGRINLDGRLSEAAWRSAPVATAFTQAWPTPGAPGTYRTEVRVLYDDAALFVGVHAFDPHPELIAAPLARRDASGIYSDWVHVVVDSYHDRRTAFRFSVNPRGVQKDVLHSDDRHEDIDWDAVWEVATTIDSTGWTAEYRIPLSQLRFGPAPAGEPRTWGFQVQRDIAQLQERDTWSPWTGNSPGYVSLAGDLTGITNLPVPSRLELLPYVSQRVTRAPGAPGDPFWHATAMRTNLGGDVKAGLPNGLTLTGTLNPDFGQVEADPAVVNLSAFETFFPEKRPFFIEGANVFDFGRLRVNSSYGYEQFFYSRRVGRPPQRSLADDSTVTYLDQPDGTTILGAAKVSGRTGPWSVGLLDAVTNVATGRFVRSDGERGTAPVEPRSNFFVGRLRRDLGPNTNVGVLLTGTARARGDSVLADMLHAGATVGGLDFEHRWANQSWALGGYVTASRVTGRPEVITSTQLSSAHYYQRPDAHGLGVDSSRTTLSGSMAELALSRDGAARFSLVLK
ncbi:MAG: carbohydrate binding family 9 domain-containing protein, partial [Candidatus Eremiobacteraeota bacterium]|nr:carbohydrate binding family 9 domain-containing protein [Candidatus Eremiobacteraeota bacterium]